MSTSTAAPAGTAPALAPWQTRAVWEDTVCASMPTAAGVAVVLRLARYMTWRERRPGWNGDPGLAQLAADLHLGEKQVSRYLADAERRGLIVTTRRHAPRSRTPHAAYAAVMPAQGALFDTPASPSPAEDQAAPTAETESDYQTLVSGNEPAANLDQQTLVSGKELDHQTSMSGDLDPHLYPFLKGSSSSADTVQIPFPPTPVGGGGEPPDDTVRVVGALARMVRGGPATELAIRSRVVELLAVGYAPGEITRHTEARTAAGRTRGTIANPAGLLRHVLADIPPSLAAQTAERDIARQREAADRRQTAAATDDTAARNMTITDMLGPDLHARIVTAAIAANPAHQRSRRSSALVRSLIANVYADHQHDLDAIRRYAEALPPVGSGADDATTQTAPYATQSISPTPTHTDGTVRPSADELAAAITARIGAA